MGRMRRFSCPACGRSWTLKLGAGLSHAVWRNVREEFPEPVRGTLPPEETNFSFRYRAAACRRCGELVSVPVLDVARNGSQYAAGCPACGGAVRLLAEDKAAFCPSCRAAELSEQTSGHWD